jgi:fatty acid synthase
VGDPEELNSIDRTICSKRDEPLLVGSIKSNIGHSEPASALSAIIKVIILIINIILNWCEITQYYLIV